ncbi:DUF4055 domain-containing protein [Lysobacter enzymogenes]|uniref:DUF4055 domain-containing protein n=1 Tax=Lysobacter enzymogenes TaxID=69 RepID=UPI001A963E50|nr:DUF4055 domain-containing protein [Lysobacter enzymogenes]QQP96539.1 DUF4055 domain-containing protein [Lysobacter enzymogenes]
MPIQVYECCAEVKELRHDWCILESLAGGTRKMRCEGQMYLPKWPAEDDESYRSRLATATLFPAWRRTVSVMSGKPFSKALSLSDADTKIEEWSTDIDQQGVSLHSFAAEMFQEVVGFGLCGILVDYPETAPVPQTARTVAQVEAAGLRPYWVRIKHNQILGWKAKSIGGRMKLMQLRLLETYEEEDGLYGSVCSPQVRVLEPGRWEIWREVKKSTGPSAGIATQTVWAKASEGRTTLSDIPFVPLYGLRKGFMIGEAPLLDLAYLNVKHWQSQSDQDTILHVARVPILCTIGADDESRLTVGASSAVKLPVNADMKFVEHSGGAITAGKTSLDDLTDQMIQTGAELLVKRGGNTTVVGDANDAEANKSDLQRIAENFEDAIDQALVYTAQFAGLKKPGSVELFDDYGAATLSDASASLVRDLAMSGFITKATALNEMKRRGVLSADVDPETEAAGVEAEGPPLGAMGQQPDPGAQAA